MTICASKDTFVPTKVLQLSDGAGMTSAKINLGNSQMFSLKHDGVEFMWGGGRPDDDKTAAEKSGWQNSEIIMFPTIGASKSGHVTIDGVEYPMGQHGTARHASFTLSDHTGSNATFVQTYKARDGVGGPGYLCSFPFDYQIKKTYSVETAALTFSVGITNLSDRPMPFAVGWHPAFLTFSGQSGEHFVRLVPAGTSIPQIYHVDAIKEKSKDGSVVESASKAEYFCPHGRISIESNLGYLQLWSPGRQNQLCIEPISARPDPNYEGELSEKQGYRALGVRATEKFAFRVEITARDDV
jgi:galactose mutarotase-like enzyme